MNLCSFSLFIRFTELIFPNSLCSLSRNFLLGSSLQAVPGDEIPYDKWKADFIGGCFRHSGRVEGAVPWVGTAERGLERSYYPSAPGNRISVPDAEKENVLSFLPTECEMN